MKMVNQSIISDLRSIGALVLGHCLMIATTYYTVYQPPAAQVAFVNDRALQQLSVVLQCNLYSNLCASALAIVNQP